MTRAKKTRVEQADITVARAAATVRKTRAMKVVGALSDVGDQPPLRTIAGATLVAGALGRSPQLTVAGVRMLVTHQLATMVKSAVKHSVDRTRPEVLLDEGHYESGEGEHSASKFSSFPSGHTAGAVAVARAIGRDYPGTAVPALVLAAGIAVVQVPRGKHYVSDILAGAVIGLVADAAVEATIKWVRSKVGQSSRHDR